MTLESTLRAHLITARATGTRLVSAKYDYPIGAQHNGGACLLMVIVDRDYSSWCRDGGDLIGDAAAVLGITRAVAEALNAGWEHWKPRKARDSFARSKTRIDPTWDMSLVDIGRKLADEFAEQP